MRRYHCKLPLKFKQFRHVPTYELQFCTNSEGKAIIGVNEYGESIYQDLKNENLMYNKSYQTIYGSTYHVFGSYYTNDGGTRYLNIQFPQTHSTAVIAENSFDKQNCEINIVDPYELRMFNNTCCIGNIDFEPLGRVEPYLDMKDGVLYYRIWEDIMGRCYDPSHRLYSLYGGYGALPALCEWRCFRYFYCMMDESLHWFNLDPNPDEPFYYLFLNQRIGFNNARAMNHFPAPVRILKREIDLDDYSFPKTKQDKKLLYRLVEDQL